MKAEVEYQNCLAKNCMTQISSPVIYCFHASISKCSGCSRSRTANYTNDKARIIHDNWRCKSVVVGVWYEEVQCVFQSNVINCRSLFFFAMLTIACKNGITIIKLIALIEIQTCLN